MTELKQALADQVRRESTVAADHTTLPGDDILHFVVMTCGMKASVKVSLPLMDGIPGSEGIVVKALLLAIGDDAITRRRARR